MIARVRNLNTWFRHTCRRFMTDRAGNIAMTFAVVSIPLLGGIGAGIDYIRAMNLQRELQSKLDAGLVAAVKDIGTKDDAALKAQLANWMAADATVAGTYTLDTNTIVIDKTNNGITAVVRANVSTTFLQILGRKTVPVAIQASVIDGKNLETKNPFSMYLVLDRSGSMAEDTDTTYTTTCYTNESRKTGPYTCTKKYTKIESLKLAVESMTTQFDKIDPDEKYIRTGAVSYNSDMQTPTPLAWGNDAVLTYVNALTATGGTSSTDAFKRAYNSIIPSSENTAHEKMNGEKNPGKYIVFMTDGDNNYSSDDTDTKKWCDKARNKSIRVFTIALMAPSKGQALLQYCATSADDYFDVTDTAELVAAFESIGKTSSKTPVRLTN
jgi:Flp pilus assembly protein TadG/uncharacterized protein YegL